MEKKIKNFIKKYILLIWIISVSLALSGFIVFANYKNNQNIAKKVVTTQNDTDIRFSSNYLEESVGVENNTTKYRNTVSLLNSALTPINVDIRNFGKNNSTLFYPTDINYTLEAILTDSSGNALSEVQALAILGSDVVTISITGQTDVELSSTSRSCTYSRTLLHGTTAAIDEFKLYFPSTTSNICVKLIATPNSIHKDLHTIGAVFSVSNKSAEQGNGWIDRFNDPTDKSPDAYDLFNYIITGYGEANSATIKWDPAVFNLENIGFSSRISSFNPVTDDTTPDGWSSCKKGTISIGQNNETRYSFQVFKGTSFTSIVDGLEAEWATNYAEMSASSPNYISKNDYLWQRIKEYIIFDDGI